MVTDTFRLRIFSHPFAKTSNTSAVTVYELTRASQIQLNNRTAVNLAFVRLVNCVDGVESVSRCSRRDVGFRS